MDAPKIVDGGFLPPSRSHEGDLPGFKPKIPLKPAPYVKEKLTGMIWHYQPWMATLGDVLDPCWEAPPKAKIQVAVGFDATLYGAAQHAPTQERPTEQQEQATPAAPQEATTSRASEALAGTQSSEQPAVKSRRKKAA